jgi:hypothetical protein
MPEKHGKDHCVDIHFHYGFIGSTYADIDLEEYKAYGQK